MNNLVARSAQQTPQFCTPAPGARADAVTASAIFAVRPQAGGLLNEKRRIQIGIITVAQSAQLYSALRKIGKKNGRRMRRRKRGRELVRVAF